MKNMRRSFSFAREPEPEPDPAEELRAELLPLKLGALSKRAAAAGVDADALEAAVDEGDTAAIIELIVSKAAAIPEGVPSVPEPEPELTPEADIETGAAPPALVRWEHWEHIRGPRGFLAQFTEDLFGAEEKTGAGALGDDASQVQEPAPSLSSAAASSAPASPAPSLTGWQQQQQPLPDGSDSDSDLGPGSGSEEEDDEELEGGLVQVAFQAGVLGIDFQWPHVEGVTEGGQAARQRVKVGMELVAVGGTRVEGLSVRAGEAIFRAALRPVELTFRRQPPLLALSAVAQHPGGAVGVGGGRGGGRGAPPPSSAAPRRTIEADRRTAKEVALSVGCQKPRWVSDDEATYCLRHIIILIGILD
jgi:hypothetical protein